MNNNNVQLTGQELFNYLINRFDMSPDDAYHEMDIKGHNMDFINDIENPFDDVIIYKYRCAEYEAEQMMIDENNRANEE